MGINNEYGYDYWDDDQYDVFNDDIDDQYEELITREDLEDMYSTELLNMWFLIHEDFAYKSYQSFCDFVFDVQSEQSIEDEPPKYIVSLWEALKNESNFLLQGKTLQDFFVYLYKC